MEASATRRSKMTVPATEGPRQFPPLELSRRELAGALGDIGVLLPLMAGLILVCGLSAFTVFLLTGATYVAAGLYFRLPVPVQPLKAMAVIAIAGGVSAREVAAGGVIMGAILLFLSATNIASRLSVLFAPWTVKGVQFAVGLMLIKSSFSFVDGSYGAVWKAAMPLDLKGAAALLLAAAAILLLLLFRHNQKVPVGLVVVVLGLGLGFVAAGPAAIGSLPAPAHRFTSLSIPDQESFTRALFLLVIPQLPLTFGNSVIATTDVAHSYFKEGARRVTPKALCASLGIANTIIGLWGGMPVCHGAGGMTAHYRLGARSGAAPLLMGAILIILALLFGDSAVYLILLLPLPVLGALMMYVGVQHARLIWELRDHWFSLVVAVVIGMVSLLLSNITVGMAVGLVVSLFMLFMRTTGLSRRLVHA